MKQPTSGTALQASMLIRVHSNTHKHGVILSAYHPLCLPLFISGRAKEREGEKRNSWYICNCQKSKYRSEEWDFASSEHSSTSTHTFPPFPSFPFFFSFLFFSFPSFPPSVLFLLSPHPTFLLFFIFPFPFLSCLPLSSPHIPLFPPPLFFPFPSISSLLIPSLLPLSSLPITFLPFALLPTFPYSSVPLYSL